MKISKILVIICMLIFAGTVHADWLDKAKDLLGNTGVSSSSATSNLTDGQISSGLKEALSVGSDIVVNQLGANNGFNGDPNVHIPLPKSLSVVQSTLSKIGQSGLMDDLETRLNRTAEIAMPKAKQLFKTAISEMTVDDARNILAGENDAATRYFQAKLTPDLVAEFTPIVNNSLAESGAIQSYDRTMTEFSITSQSKKQRSEQTQSRAQQIY